jgi:hypothetical protein
LYINPAGCASQATTISILTILYDIPIVLYSFTEHPVPAINNPPTADSVTPLPVADTIEADNRPDHSASQVANTSTTDPEAPLPVPKSAVVSLDHSASAAIDPSTPGTVASSLAADVVVSPAHSVAPVNNPSTPDTEAPLPATETTAVISPGHSASLVNNIPAPDPVASPVAAPIPAISPDHSASPVINSSTSDPTPPSPLAEITAAVIPDHSETMAANIPAKLKAADLTRFIVRAAQLESAKPVVAYWCRLFSPISWNATDVRRRILDCEPDSIEGFTQWR